MGILRNAVIKREKARPICYDFFPADHSVESFVIFSHGFKGFKDWGNWNEMAIFFQYSGYHFIKFNFSLNGGTPEEPIDFPDLNAFAQNTYSQELRDLDDLLNHVGGDLFPVMA